MGDRCKKSICAVIFDVSEANKANAYKAFMKICGYKFFTKSKDLIVKLILFNTAEKKNLKNYKNIYICNSNIRSYDPKNFEDFLDVTSSDARGNWLEALQIGLNALRYDLDDVKMVVCKQLLFLSDLKTPIDDTSLLPSIVRLVKELKVCLYFVGPDIEFPFCVKNTNDIKPAMASLEFNEKNLMLAKDIVLKTNKSVICNYKLGLHLFTFYKCSGGRQPWKVPLEIGTKIKFKVITTKYMDKGVICNAKKRAREPKEILWVDAEDLEKRYDFKDVVHGISRHGKFVALEKEAKVSFKSKNPRGFHILMFTEAKNVPEYFIQGDETYIVVPENRKSRKFNLFVNYLAENNMYIIARRVYAKNYKPKFVVLIPKPNWERKCFVLCKLPYEDDVRADYQETEYNLDSKSDETIDEITAFLDSLDVDEGNINIPLGINLMRNPHNVKFVNKAMDKYLDKHLDLESLDISYLNIKRDESLEENAKQLIEDRQPPDENTNNNEVKAEESEDDFVLD